METAERISLPDDCTVGYIVNALLGASLIRSPFFHSHLENLGVVSDIPSQVEPACCPRVDQCLLMQQLTACSPLGDAQLRNSGEQEEHGQPERALVNEGGSYEVKHPSQCSLGGGKSQRVHGSSTQTFPERTGQKYTSLVYIMVWFPVGEQNKDKRQTGCI